MSFVIPPFHLGVVIRLIISVLGKVELHFNILFFSKKQSEICEFM